MNLTRPYNAQSETLSLTDVKNHLRITHSDDDDKLRQLIAAVREKTEHELGKTLVTSTRELKLDAFPDEIGLDYRPVQSITSIEYIDTDGANQTLAADQYQFDRQGRVKPSYGNSWPDTRDAYDAVTITYVAGETHAGNVPQDIKLAMLLMIGHYDLNAENSAFTQIITIPEGAKSLLAPHKVHML